MALAFARLSPNPDHISGNKKIRYRKVTFDSAYPDGGEAVTAANFELTSLEMLEILGVVHPEGTETAFVAGYDVANSKLILFEGDNNNAADAPLIEIDTTNPDISTFFVFVKAIGW